MSELLQDDSLLGKFEDLLREHSDEIYGTQQDVDYGTYLMLEEEGKHALIFCLYEEEILGYASLIHSHNIHLKAPVTLCDAIYVDPACRGKGVGSDLLTLAERASEEAGSVKLNVHMKQAGRLQDLGYQEQEIVYTKFLGV